MKYVVNGGIYEDFSFQNIDPETIEFYGPFNTYSEAYDVWKAKMWLNVDNALHKLKIVEVENY